MTDDTRASVSTRRRYLAMFGSGALSAGLAGCSTTTTSDPTPGTPPSTATADGTGGNTPDAGAVSGDTAGLDPCLRPASDSTCSSPVEVTSGVVDDTVWGGDCDEYLVSRTVRVQNGATLTVEPGTRVVFGQNASLHVDADSALSAVGSCGDPIVFTGEQETRGYWGGVQFDQADRVASELAYCVVEYGGGDEFSRADQPGNLVVTRGARVSVTNSAIREGAGYGVVLDSDVRVDEFGDNVVTANADGAAYAYGQTADSFSAASSYVGNDDDAVVLRGGEIARDDEPTWDAIDVPYRVSTGRGVTVYGHLTVAPGATVEFGQNAWLSMDPQGPGRLTAVGVDPETEQTRPITFTGEQKTRGYWRGIQFRGSDRTENRLQHCVVEYAGSERFSRAEVRANVVVIDDSRVRIADSTVRECDGYGVQIDNSSRADGSIRNTITRNAAGAAYAGGRSARFLHASGTYVGNDEDVVAVRRGELEPGDEHTWNALDVPYRVLAGQGVTVNGHLTVAPGTTVEFGQNAWLSMNREGPGRLTAVGIDPDERTNPITFTGEQKTRGYWRGIQFRGSNRTENRLRNCVVEYAGSEQFSRANSPANIVVLDGSRLFLRDSTVRNSAGYAVDVDADATLEAYNNVYSNNAAGDVLN
ncbi:hypothetical protein NDI56_01915 [Haloarcula sp. S1CR25-12]|uniref:Right-handed parallel beta-helix repeat-containing protein n=1 Tax=Haloarcula saliterrae TaxID=2950534 RepID=A0ABU2F7J4_9EURY|nr:hypothetical protein [Haloarcula sp. S1CR25-12]MDS0258161.1 hypothetical protein [Haloarcula sp. S1CR25-12]